MNNEETKQETKEHENKDEAGGNEDEVIEDMAGTIAEIQEQIRKKPKKGILKQSASFEAPDAPNKREKKSAKWDEMNIIATLHPADKDYGFMKIDEPPTPYEVAIPDEDTRDGAVIQLDAAALADKIRLAAAAEESNKGARKMSSESPSDSEPEDDETPEQRAARKEFEMKRKAHYNEYFAAKLARKLMEEEDEDDDEEEGEEGDEESKGCSVPSESSAGASCQ